MNKPLAVWGLLLFIGFLATHYLMFSYSYAYMPLAWIVLLALGIGYCKAACRRKKGRCRCMVSDVWAVGIVEGVALTAAIMVQLLPISPFYILSAWLLAAGSALVAESLRSKKIVEMQLGLFWLFSAVFFPFVSNYQYSTFIIGALVFGIPMIIAGLVEKK